MVISSIKELESSILHINIYAKYSDTNSGQMFVGEGASSMEGAQNWVGISLF